MHLDLVAQISRTQAVGSYGQGGKRPLQHPAHKGSGQDSDAKNRKDGVQEHLAGALRDTLFGAGKGDVGIENA